MVQEMQVFRNDSKEDAGVPDIPRLVLRPLSVSGQNKVMMLALVVVEVDRQLTRAVMSQHELVGGGGGGVPGCC